MATVRIDETTPNGGTYSIATYMNRKHEATSIDNAEIIVIREFDKDDNLLYETFGFTKKEKN